MAELKRPGHAGEVPKDHGVEAGPPRRTNLFRITSRNFQLPPLLQVTSVRRQTRLSLSEVGLHGLDPEGRLRIRLRIRLDNRG